MTRSDVKAAGDFQSEAQNVEMPQSRFYLFNELALPTPGQRVVGDSVPPLKTNWPLVQSGRVAKFWKISN